MFFDFHVNFVEFNVELCLEFIGYCAFRCNGTILIAEIHRLVMEDVEKYRKIFNKTGRSMYTFLCLVNQKISSKCVGSCTDPRFTFSQGSNETKWNTRTKELLALCLLFYDDEVTETRQDKVFAVASNVMNTLVTSKTTFKGVGAMGANQFVHLAALTGLIPLCCYNYAELKDVSLGPAKLIKEGYKEELEKRKLAIEEAKKAAMKETKKVAKRKANHVTTKKRSEVPPKKGKKTLAKKGKEAASREERKECNDEEQEDDLSFCRKKFSEICLQLKKVWGILVTIAVMENLLCELCRSIEATNRKMKKSNKLDDMGCVVDIAIDSFKESPKNDLFFFDEQRQCLQNFFYVTTVSKKACGLRPQLLMKNSQHWKEGSSKWLKCVTNWQQDNKDKQLVFWSDKKSSMTLKTSLKASLEFKEIMRLDNHSIK